MQPEAILDELKWRGLWADCTDEAGLAARLAEGPVTVYAGFDPTADSLHVGHLLPLLGLRRFQQFGHTPVALAGGATGSIGDPSGKSDERNLLSRDEIAANVAKITGQLERLMDFTAAGNAARLANNADWFAAIGFLDFLRDVGKHFSVNAMVAKESVRNRMEGAGISYTEFSYMLLQAYDFYHLHQTENCELQIGGSDQWGNITAGMELIRRKAGAGAFGLTMPLLTKADGTKFGKTAGGAVWLDPARTSPYKFYQFWINTEDAKVVECLKYFTFLEREEIETLEAQHGEAPGAREAQRRLAEEVTTLVHGADATADAVRASRILFGGDVTGVSEAVFEDVAAEVPRAAVRLDADGLGLLDALVAAKLCGSKGQARKDAQGGGVYLNNVRVEDAAARIGGGDFLFGKYVLLRRGKKNYAVLEREQA
ncbi:MAG: tyrosine--tRNA ligase [Verrucomicrobiota bacterium]